MADQAQTPSGPTEGMVMVDEMPPFPTGPTDANDAPAQDTGFIMDTLFGESAPVPNSDGGQAQGPKPSDAQTPGTPPAPPTPAPAANGGDGSPQPGPSPTPAAVPPQAEPAAGGQPPQTPAPGTVPAAAATPPAQPELDPETRLRLAGEAALRAQNAELLRRLEQLERGPAPAGQPGQPGQPAQPAKPEQVWLAVPDDLAAQIFNEDAGMARQGMNTLISALATTVTNNVLQRVDAMMNQRFQAVDQQAQQVRAAQTQEEQYYEAFPVHKNELYRPVIQATVDELYKELPHLTWDQTTIAAVGARVNKKLSDLGINVGMVPAAPAQTTPAAGTVPANGAPRPAPMLDSSTRGGGTPVEGSDFIAATFG